ncbi:UDP-N-acetylmuramyl pentapeptide synthase [endosymbiont of Sipalinus gigas]|uniref:UDP-N-acetylmuramoyl-tripeptide--D-alanyl-D- alanine ligase n=1 Tax=endosymbiont of Sipalinus gigas TaxID=1972134 RepID=UPI000DC73121|nr:UDP-N-acetylmuramoyl-tripeptide--D-alanyl-D-alanine ligase [endosymbiont of Sipalinus gigas]BBA85174.1 UDP-N-acetylmuramyl pentapeptide synthase [endosymbiont of Sipalinus gigas]
MFELNLYKISEIVNGELLNCNKNILILTYSINSREIKNNCIFIAFKGKNFDGHEFIQDSIKNGAKSIIVSKFVKNINIPQIIVKDTYLALKNIASYIRKISKSFFISITGSCGKTTVKEILYNIINNYSNNITYTYKNNNNNIGVILTILNIKKTDKYVIIEVGANTPYEIYESIKIINPDLILINNLYISHLKFFKTFEILSNSKGEIFYGLKNNGRILLNYDNNNWDNWKYLNINIGKSPLFFSLNYNKNVDFYASNINLNKFKSNFVLNTPIGNKIIEFNILGIHNIYNILAASSLSIISGINLECIYNGIKNFNGVIGRLYPYFLRNNEIILIDDSYNANMGSIYTAIKVLEKMPGYKIFVIGDLNELGCDEIKYHIDIKLNIKNNNYNINKIFSFGKLSKFITNGKNHFYDKKDLFNSIKNIFNEHKYISILIKGSRTNLLDELVNNILFLFK